MHIWHKTGQIWRKMFLKLNSMEFIELFFFQFWSQQGFQQPRFWKKCNLWSLSFDGRTNMKFLFITSMEKKKCEDMSSFYLSNTSPCIQEGDKEKHQPIFTPPPSKKNFINNISCRNGAVRNPAGTRLYSSLVKKQVTILLVPIFML